MLPASELSDKTSMLKLPHDCGKLGRDMSILHLFQFIESVSGYGLLVCEPKLGSQVPVVGNTRREETPSLGGKNTTSYSQMVGGWVGNGGLDEN